jgi:uncharacterized damage-inducible protein DinB
MTTTALDDAFAHHVWATEQVIDACLELSPDQLGTSVPGTYGSILDTIRHIVGADAGYLFILTGGNVPLIDHEQMDLPALRAAMTEGGRAWSALLAQDRSPDEMVVRHRDDGSESRAPFSIRLAQALHHGTDHRSQICTALTALGIEPPEIDLWAYASLTGRASQTPPST